MNNAADPRTFVDGVVSTHPVAATAVGEIVGALMDRNHLRPDVLFVFVTRPFAGTIEDIAAGFRHLVAPTTLVGCAASRVILPEGGSAGVAAISVLAIGSIALQATRYEGGVVPVEQPGTTTMVIADPYSTQISLMSRFTGGYASAGNGPGRNRLVLNDRIYADGCIALEFPTAERAIACFDANTLSVTEWLRAEALLAFSDEATMLWHDAVSVKSEENAEYPPVLSGFVSQLTFPSALTVIGGGYAGGSLMP